MRTNWALAELREQVLQRSSQQVQARGLCGRARSCRPPRSSRSSRCRGSAVARHPAPAAPRWISGLRMGGIAGTTRCLVASSFPHARQRSMQPFLTVQACCRARPRPGAHRVAAWPCPRSRALRTDRVPCSPSDYRECVGPAGIRRERLQVIPGDSATAQLTGSTEGVHRFPTLPWPEDAWRIRKPSGRRRRMGGPGRAGTWLSERKAASTSSHKPRTALGAAESIARHAPDVAFLDIQMPGLSGLEVAAQLERSNAPLLVLSPRSTRTPSAPSSLSAIDYLLKPFDKDRLDSRRWLACGNELATARRGWSRGNTARAQTHSSERLLVPEGGQLQLLDTATIECIEADDNYVHVHTPGRSLPAAQNAARSALQARRAPVRAHSQVRRRQSGSDPRAGVRCSKGITKCSFAAAEPCV